MKLVITSDNILDWFEIYFVLEAKAYCDSLGLDHNCKILDDAYVRQLLCSSASRTRLKKIVFDIYLPPNNTSLIQTQDNGILRSF